MSPVLATVVAAIVVTAGSIIVGVITVRQNRRGQQATTALEARKVNRDEFDSITRELWAQLKRSDDRIQVLEEALMEERAAREAADDRARVAEERAQAAERRAERLERRVDQLENVMSAAGLEIPAPLPDD